MPSGHSWWITQVKLARMSRSGWVSRDWLPLATHAFSRRGSPSSKPCVSHDKIRSGEKSKIGWKLGPWTLDLPLESSLLAGASSLHSARSRDAAADWMPNHVTKSWRRISPMKRTRNSTNASRSRWGWAISASCSVGISRALNQVQEDVCIIACNAPENACALQSTDIHLIVITIMRLEEHLHFSA